MDNEQFGGKLTLRDPSTGQQHSCSVWGTVSYQAPGDPAAASHRVQQALVGAVEQVLIHKLSQGQVAMATLATSAPHYAGEIIAAAGLQNAGIHITQLALQLQLQQPLQAAVPAAMPPTPMQSLQNAAVQHAQEAADPRNYEVRGQLRIGGIKIKGSTSGGIDTDSLGHQLKEEAKSQVIWYAAGCGILLLVVIGMAGLGWYIYAQATTKLEPGAEPTGAAEVVKWDGKKAFRCGGSDNVIIEDVKAKLKKGTAITAGANCRLELKNVDIDAPTGIKALGHAVVTVRGGSVKSTTAASALGHGKVVFKGTDVTGKTKALGSNAKIVGP